MCLISLSSSPSVSRKEQLESNELMQIGFGGGSWNGFVYLILWLGWQMRLLVSTTRQRRARKDLLVFFYHQIIFRSFSSPTSYSIILVNITDPWGQLQSNLTTSRLPAPPALASSLRQSLAGILGTRTASIDSHHQQTFRVRLRN